MRPSPTVSIKRTYRGPLPHIPYEKMARAILGPRYELSLVICGDALSRRINHTYRRKDYAPNVLSFPLDKHSGEVFLNIHKAEREARAFGMPLRDRLALLFVHGCFHLKGLQHGRTMEGMERDMMRAFSFKWHGNSTQG